MQPASFAERNEAGKQKARPVKPGFLFTEISSGILADPAYFTNPTDCAIFDE
jgi:hypothetical protein